jgi:hypothetical protein
VSVIIHATDRGMQHLIEHRLADKQVRRAIWKALRVGANVLRREIRAQAPVKAKTEGGRAPRMALKRSVQIKRSRRAGSIAYVVGPMGPSAFHRSWVIQGTRPHMVGKRRHPGARGNPFTVRAAEAAKDAALEATKTALKELLG